MPRFPADMLRARPLLAFAMLSCVANARAQSSSSTDTLDLPDSRARATLVTPSSSERHRLEGEALRRFATLEDALASLPGFRVRAQDGLGGYSELRFRGARASQIEITVDGARLGGDGDSPTDLGRWPLLWFSSLEAGAATEGSDPGALATIDLSTRAGHDSGGAALRARIGSFGAVEAALSAQGSATGGWSWSAGAQGQSARNDYRFFSDNSTLYNTTDDGTWRMENNAWNSRGLRASARREVPGESQVFSALWLETRKEYPGLFPSEARAFGTRSEWLAAWRMDRTESDAWGWSARAQARGAEDGYRDS
ncbi:MAG TPA: TonB-dependent receptor, partial [Fibrobacteria bacterium]|nr:TonB-dependent receptor [Fibrobacteria bacterium]